MRKKTKEDKKVNFKRKIMEYNFENVDQFEYLEIPHTNREEEGTEID